MDFCICKIAADTLIRMVCDLLGMGKTDIIIEYSVMNHSIIKRKINIEQKLYRNNIEQKTHKNYRTETLEKRWMVKNNL